MILILGLVISMLLGQTLVPEMMAETSYFKSETFMETLADLTVYLKQVKIEEKPVYFTKYETMNNIQYYIEGRHNGERKVVSNANLDGGELEYRKKHSKFYMVITFSDAKNYSIESSIGAYSYGHQNYSINIFKSVINRKIQEESIGRSNEPLGYEQLRIYYFIPNGRLTTDDFIDTNIARYEKTARFKIALVVHLLLGILYIAGLVVGCYKNIFKGKSWSILRKINLELKILGAILIFYELRNVYWKLRQPNALARILEGSMETKIYWIGLYVLGGILLLCALAWYMVELSYRIRNRDWRTIKEESFLVKHKQQVLKYVQVFMGWIYRIVGIDLRRGFYTQLILFNVLHLGALIFIVGKAWHNVGDGVLLGMFYTMFWGFILLGILLDFSRMKKQLKIMNVTEKVDAIKLPYMKMILGLVIYALSLIVLAIVSFDSDILGLLLAVIIGIGVAVYNIFLVKSYQELYWYVIDIRERRSGNKPTYNFLSPIIDELAIIDEGFQNAVNKEFVSQRMKTELISNVSHDLKTPLTSIINYVDLLKDTQLSQAKQQEYVQILEQKSQRLKILIEDLFEASKTASGNIELVKEKIDLVALLKQTLGEMDEKISGSTLKFKNNFPEQKAICELDGRRTYRIFENLIGNILKYSAPQSRVYIDCQVDEEITLTFKNISAYEMNFTVEEIMERFKRGDESRHTEGSGLGLAIAKNLTELQGGQFEIYIDGDLFKVVIKFKSNLTIN